jgi:hypothetical protein
LIKLRKSYKKHSFYNPKSFYFVNQEDELKIFLKKYLSKNIDKNDVINYNRFKRVPIQTLIDEIYFLSDICSGNDLCKNGGIEDILFFEDCHLYPYELYINRKILDDLGMSKDELITDSIEDLLRECSINMDILNFQLLFGDFLHQKHLPADFIYVSDADFDLN